MADRISIGMPFRCSPAYGYGLLLHLADDDNDDEILTTIRFLHISRLNIEYLFDHANAFENNHCQLKQQDNNQIYPYPFS